MLGEVLRLAGEWSQQPLQPQDSTAVLYQQDLLRVTADLSHQAVECESKQDIAQPTAAAWQCFKAPDSTIHQKNSGVI